MIERPIIFCGEMILAILNGRKTMTRRIVKPQSDIIVGDQLDPHRWYAANRGDFAGDPDREIKCPYKCGRRLWVREIWAQDLDGEVFHRADYDAKPSTIDKWRPAIFMPRYASRITLEITDVRVERLQDITEEDAQKEGVETEPVKYGDACYVDAFIRLWDSLNKKRGGYGWEKNPWVWVNSFIRI